jgi:hypothetical protein
VNQERINQWNELKEIARSVELGEEEDVII